MKNFKLSFLVTIIMSMFSALASAHDIEVKNANGVTIYYTWANNNTELEVSYRGTSYSNYDNEYKGVVVIPDKVTYNGKTYSVTSIGNYAFSDCSGLTNITIPEGVTTIGADAFSGCSSLTSITIPSGVTSIGYRAFDGCSGLTKIQVDEANKVYDSRNNCNAIIGTASNILISGCKNTVIFSSVTSIGSSAFYGCSGLTNITIPEGVTTIGDCAFAGCSGLTNITIPSSVTSIGNYAFYGCI